MGADPGDQGLALLPARAEEFIARTPPRATPAPFPVSNQPGLYHSPGGGGKRASKTGRAGDSPRPGGTIASGGKVVGAIGLSKSCDG